MPDGIVITGMKSQRYESGRGQTMTLAQYIIKNVILDGSPAHLPEGGVLRQTFSAFAWFYSHSSHTLMKKNHLNYQQDDKVLFQIARCMPTLAYIARTTSLSAISPYLRAKRMPRGAAIPERRPTPAVLLGFSGGSSRSLPPRLPPRSASSRRRSRSAFPCSRHTPQQYQQSC